MRENAKYNSPQSAKSMGIKGSKCKCLTKIIVYTFFCKYLFISLSAIIYLHVFRFFSLYIMLHIVYYTAVNYCLNILFHVCVHFYQYFTFILFFAFISSVGSGLGIYPTSGLVFRFPPLR